jgi:hypothetical protein
MAPTRQVLVQIEVAAVLRVTALVEVPADLSRTDEQRQAKKAGDALGAELVEKFDPNTAFMSGVYHRAGRRDQTEVFIKAAKPRVRPL